MVTVRSTALLIPMAMALTMQRLPFLPPLLIPTLTVYLTGMTLIVTTMVFLTWLNPVVLIPMVTPWSMALQTPTMMA